MAYNIFEHWPFTSFQNLNLDWLLNAMKETRRIADNSYQIAEDTAAEVETFSGRINTANDHADSALQTAEVAQTAAEAAAQAAAAADDLLFLFATADNHAVDYNRWAEGSTDYVTAADIFSALTVDHKLPVFMDREQNVYNLSGYERSGLSVTRWRFTRYGGNGREYIAWIDATGTISYTHSDSGGSGAGAFVVTITRSQSTGNTTSDKTYSEVAAAYTAGQAVICHVVDEIGQMDFYTAKCEIATAGANSIYRWESPQQYDPPRFHIAFLREDGLTGIYVSYVLPSVSASDNGKFLRVVEGEWEVVAGDEYSALPSDTASGAIASFPDGADDAPVKSLMAQIAPVQTGSGDPSPTNIRPISGWTSATVTRTGADNRSDTYTIAFPAEAGTVYGGTLDAANGVLTVDSAIVDMGTLNWTYYPNQRRMAVQVKSAKPAGSNVGLDGACSVYKVIKTGYQSAPDKSIVIGNDFISQSYAAMVVYDSDYTDAATFKTAVSGQTLVYPIKNPVTYQLDPVTVTTILGVNNIWADTGDVAVDYRADTGLYIQKLIHHETVAAESEE